MGTFVVESGKHTKLPKAFVVEGGKYVKLSKAFVVENGKYVKLWSGFTPRHVVSDVAIPGSSNPKYYIHTSENGIDWNRTEIVGGGLTAYYNHGGVTFGNGVYVAALAEKMAYSYDGVNWTVYNAPEFQSGAYVHQQTLAFCNGRFVMYVLMNNLWGDVPKRYFATSVDGINWSVKNVADNVANIDKIFYVNYKGSNRYVAVSNNCVYYSTNLSSWTRDEIIYSFSKRVYAPHNYAGLVGISTGYDSAYCLAVVLPITTGSSGGGNTFGTDYDGVTSVSTTVYNYDNDTLYIVANLGLFEWVLGTNPSPYQVKKSSIPYPNTALLGYGGGRYIKSDGSKLWYSNDNMATWTATNETMYYANFAYISYGVEQPRG